MRRVWGQQSKDGPYKNTCFSIVARRYLGRRTVRTVAERPLGSPDQRKKLTIFHLGRYWRSHDIVGDGAVSSDTNKNSCRRAPGSSSGCRSSTARKKFSRNIFKIKGRIMNGAAKSAVLG